MQRPQGDALSQPPEDGIESRRLRDTHPPTATTSWRALPPLLLDHHYTPV